MIKFLLKIKKIFLVKRIIVLDSIILLVVAVIPFLFHGRYLIYNSIIDVYINPVEFFKRLLYLWNSKEWAGTSFGWGSSFLFPFTSFFAFFSFFKLSAAVVERLWFIFILFQCGISIYYLAFVLFGEKYRLARFIAAVAYMYNLYVFIGLQGASVLLLPYAVAPLMLCLYIRGISSRNYLKFGILFGLTSTIMSFISPPLVVANTIVIVLYSFYHLFVIEGRKGFFPVVKTSISSLLFSLALNLWVILLVIYYLRSSYLADMSSIFSEKLTWINSGTSFIETFRLLGIWYFYTDGAPGVPNFSYSALFRDNGIFIFLSFLLPISSLFALTIKRANKYVSFFGLLILVAIPMAVGIYPPDNLSLIGKIYLWVYQKIPFFNIFKDNYRPFVAMIALSYSVLLGYLANFLFLHLKEKLSFTEKKSFFEVPKRFKFLLLSVREIKSTFDTRFKKIIPFIPPVFIISIILVISFPIITGNIFYEKMKIKQIPDYWYASAKWINDQKEDFRIFFLPEQRMALYLWSHTVGEISLSLYQKSQIFTVASIAERPNVDLINQIYRSISQNSMLDTAKMAGLMNIKYILQRNDYDWSLSVKGESPEYAKSILESKENISFSKTFGQLDFYQVSNQYFLPHFYIPQNIIYSNGDVESLADIVSFEDYEINRIEPKKTDVKLQIPKITFVKINPTKYRVKVKGAKEPYTLVFSESFHEGWKAYISDQQSVISDQYGGIVASYFDGEVKEGTHKNIFLDKNTFETWGKKPIPEEKHLLVNGYASSWYITPEDAGAKEDYEIIIEFWPQRLFYIGLTISALTFLGCLCYLSYDLYMKKKRLNVK